MTVALTVALVLTFGGFLLLLDRRDQREREERAMLLQRIQAPEVAVVDYSQQQLPDDPSGHPYTDVELAEREKAIAFLEQYEGVET